MQAHAYVTKVHRLWLFVALCSDGVHSFNHFVARSAPGRLNMNSPASSCDGDNDDGGRRETLAWGAGDVSPAAVTMDDGGSDLTDRFKYKVHALMGTYDPPAGTVDDENQTGNILGAMLQFPAEYTFSVVGRNAAGGPGDQCSGSPGGEYADEVKRALIDLLGPGASDGMELRVVPRGEKFTRVSAKVMVDSASVISSVYEKLGALEATVMKF